MTKPTSRSSAFAPFDVVVVPFPYTDRLAEKRRPAVVISTKQLSRYGFVWLAMVTSADNPHWDCDVGISDNKAAGLPAPSVVRPAKIATADAVRVVRRIGRLAAKDSEELSRRIGSFMAKPR